MIRERRFLFFIMGAALPALALLLPPGAVQGKYLRSELVDVPVERIIKNLEEVARTDPENVTVRFTLARAHAMVYALKSDTLEAIKGQEDRGPWFGHEPPLVPREVRPTADPRRLSVAREHLAKAIEWYEETLKLDPNDLRAALGRAWCVDQSGDKERAIKAYRRVAAAAWEKEKALKRAPLGWLPITAEAAGYLIPLLDKQRDRREIGVLRYRIEKTTSIPRPVTPIAIPLRDGLAASDLEDRSARVAFDADGTGLRKRWSWITGDAGWLVHDPRATGRIDSALQLFGGVTFWMFWENGYQALAALDNDRNGLLTGEELRGLAIWRDLNGNGISDRGEVKSLTEWGIVGISCRYAVDSRHPDRIAYSPRGVVFRDGSSRPSYDLILREQQGPAFAE
ncbi:MAG TPA: hypothetical protein VJ302_27465 [Blastocatellia bacterium]|nr:hypothetical protein [Blastocatellia bacterium]